MSSLFESFNARALSPKEVALTFVPPPTFRRVIRRNNAIIVGPRGSGKTTLLKMLQQTALENWNHPEVESYLPSIDYTSVFIPTDRRWDRQLKSLGEYVSDKDLEYLIRAAFVTHALHALVVSMINRVKVPNGRGIRAIRRVELSNAQEAKMVEALSRSWALQPQFNSLLGLKHALTERLGWIRTIAIEGRLDIGYLHLPLLESITLGIELFNDISGCSDDRWALAFDELELAPSFIRNDLVDAIRASDDRLIFKLAISPVNDQVSSLEGAFNIPGHDYDPIRLWYTERREGASFCRSLWGSITASRGLGDIDPKEVMGLAYFEDPSVTSTGVGKYAPGSRWSKMFQNMYSEDPTFKKYIESKNIDISDLEKAPQRDRDQVIRKIAPLLPFRRFYRSVGDKPRQKTRSRKKATIYSGAESVFAITEGNPRWFIGLVNGLLDSYDEKRGRINKSTQARELERVAHRFSALLRTIVVESATKYDGGVLGLIDQIADFIYLDHVVAAFKPEPASSFLVPIDIEPSIELLLNAALNVGALVYLPEEDEVIIDSVKGKRFRLTYVLAPRYGLPIRLTGKSVSLKTILKSGLNKNQASLDLNG